MKKHKPIKPVNQSVYFIGPDGKITEAPKTLSLNTITYLSLIGQKGGKSGTGKAKKRGDSAHYKRIAKLKRKAKK